MNRVPEHQRDRLREYGNRARAIDAMFARCVKQQEQLEADTGALLQVIRQDFQIPAEREFYVCHDSGDIVVLEPPAQEAGNGEG